MPGGGGDDDVWLGHGGEQCVGIATRHVGLKSNALLEAGVCSECRFPGPVPEDSLTK